VCVWIYVTVGVCTTFSPRPDEVPPYSTEDILKSHQKLSGVITPGVSSHLICVGECGCTLLLHQLLEKERTLISSSETWSAGI
jgi:hypothetical protein